MVKNDIVRLSIENITGEGSGVGRYDGMVVFVPFSAVGDLLDVRIVKTGKSYCYGKIEQIITPSPDRVSPDCKVFGKCGGCAFRHISYEAELRAKEDIIRSAFTRIGGLDPEFLPIIPGGSRTGYRNKAQYPVGRDKDGNIASGFYAARSHRIVPCDKCMLEPDIFGEIRNFVLRQAALLRISPYNEEQHSGVLRHICIRKGHYSGEICTVLVVRRNVPELKKLAYAVMKAFPAVKGVTANINKDITNVIFGDTDILLCGSADINDTMLGKTFSISPRSFYQVNTPMAEKLYSEAAKLAEPDGKNIIDLYCGIGTVGITMSDNAASLTGVEVIPEAVENAIFNAKTNCTGNVRFYCGDAGKITSLLRKDGTSADVVIVDPARKGCDTQTLDNIISFSPERVVMISCNPATAARDCKYLSEHGYNAVNVRGVDLFPGTIHVEAVILLTRNSSE